MVMSAWRWRPCQKAPLEVVETQFFFQLLVSLLANPSRLEGGDCDRALPTIRLGYVNAPRRYRSRPRKSTVRGRTLAVWGSGRLASCMVYWLFRVEYRKAGARAAFELTRETG